MTKREEFHIQFSSDQRENDDLTGAIWRIWDRKTTEGAAEIAVRNFRACHPQIKHVRIKVLTIFETLLNA